MSTLGRTLPTKHISAVAAIRCGQVSKGEPTSEPLAVVTSTMVDQPHLLRPIPFHYMFSSLVSDSAHINFTMAYVAAEQPILLFPV
jgi:hypothetical protein